MQLLPGRRHSVGELAFSPDGRFLAAGGSALSAWDLTQAKPRHLWPGPSRPAGTVRRLAFVGPAALVALESGAWRRYDLAAGAAVDLALPTLTHALGAIVDPTRGVLKCVDFLWINQLRGTSAQAMTFPITPAGLGELAGANEVHADRGLIAFAPGGAAYLGVEGQRVRLFDSATDAAAATLEVPPYYGNGSGDRWNFAPDGRRVYTPRYGRLVAYDAAGGAAGLGCEPYALAVHPGGRLLAVLEDSAAVTFRDAESLEVTRRYDFNLPMLRALAFSPDGTRCVVGNARGKVLLFDVDD